MIPTDDHTIVPVEKDNSLKLAVKSIEKTLRELNENGYCDADSSCLDESEDDSLFVESICKSFEINLVSTLEQYLEPVRVELKKLDVQKLLQQDKKEMSSKVDKTMSESSKLRPIHDLIYPPTPAMFVNNEDCSYVRYLHVAENEVFSIGVFVFPPNAKIPLHDHPGMCVLSRVLYGELNVTSYDLINEGQTGLVETSEKNNSSWISSFFPSLSLERKSISFGGKHAIKNKSKTIRSSDVATLFPLKGNMHEFKAGREGAAVLDVLMPPYDDDERECTYFREESTLVYDDQVSVDVELRTLVPIRQPNNFRCVSGDFGSFTS